MAVKRGDEHRRYSRAVTRTRRWKALRHAILERDEWKCRECGEQKRLEVDHIKPVRTHPELSFAPGNLQVLCGSCHARKTLVEVGFVPPDPPGPRRDWRLAVAELMPSGPSVPYGCKPSRIPVKVVCGPPGAGKTTYVREEARPGDMVIDLDDFLEEVGGRRWDTDKKNVRAAFKLRDKAIRSLSQQRTGRAWLIVTAPTEAERKAWKKALWRVTFKVLAVDADTCKARISADPDRKHAVEALCASVDRWWAQFDETPANEVIPCWTL